MRRSMLVVALSLIATNALAQISPGPLSKAHEQLDGMRQCRTCHGGGDDGLDQKCLDCHGGLQWTIAQDRGLHAREGRTDCASCHPEHAGREFELIEWDRDGFDHERAGWTRNGAHARIECDRCHREELRQRNVLLRRPEGASAQTWLGLDGSSCLSCHRSPHSERIGSDCAACHTENKWTEVERFDHGRTAYALTGKHASAECAACHREGKFGSTPGSTSGMHYAPIAFDECSPCHNDPHADRFGAQCSSCHVTTDFRQVAEGRFEHARTRFPLRAAHAKVSCARCHDPAAGGWGKQPAFDRCGACHTDAHAGTATLAGAAVDCNRCHGEDSFKATTFDLAMHAASRYPLLGKHEQLECSKCHHRDETNPAFGVAGIDLRPAFGACRDCHADDHAGQFGERYDGGACESCHVVQGWRPSTFGIEAHASTGFALEGVHRSAECRVCHATGRIWVRDPATLPTPGKAELNLVRPERVCADCHVDVHRARYRDQSCAGCHDQTRFVPSSVGVTQHDGYAFRLDGAHRATPCFLCHKQLDSRSHLPPETHALIGEVAPPDVVLWELSSACQSCHKTEVKP